MTPNIQANFHLYAEDIHRAVAFYARNFNFEFMGQLRGENRHEWAALKTANAILWLGPSGSKTGLILLIDTDLAGFVARLKNDGVSCFIPEQFASASPESDDILVTNWGKHIWFWDSEGNAVMLFEPIAG